jgi:predicted nuclease of predicted toxin-antitoxin system
VLYIAEHASGSTDIEALRQALDEQRLFLTEDKDFGELVFRFKLAVPGLVLLRIRPERSALKWARLETAIASFHENLFGRYIVVSETRLRARPLLSVIGDEGS